MVKMTIQYDGELRCSAAHGPSGSTIETDAPADNCGKAERFSPTDLVGAALATCVITTIGILAQRKGWDVSGMRAEVTKTMSADTPRRIVRLPVDLWMARNHPEDIRKQIEAAARGCPVHRSLGDGVDSPVTIHWP